MLRHTRSGAIISIALSLVAIGCGEKAPSAPISEGSGAGPAQIALTRRADTVVVDESVQLSAIIPQVPGTETPSVSWSSSDPNVAIVTQNGVLFALKSGRTTVSVTARGYSDATTVTVRASVREVTFDNDSLAISLAQSVKLPYRVTDSDGNEADLSQHKVEWSSTDPAVADVASGGTVTGRAIGSAGLLLRVDNKVATTGVRVVSKPVASVFSNPSSLALAPGQTAQLVATTYDVNGDPITGRKLSWSSSNNGVATVSSSGLVTTIAVGKADITANASGRKTIVPVTVSAPTSPSTAATPVASVVVAVNAPTLLAGQSTQATATPKDADGNALTGRSIVWTSSEVTVASVNATGLVTALKAGAVTITASAEDKSGSASLVAEMPAAEPVSSVTLSVASSVNVGQTTQATVTLKDANGNVLTGRTVNWVSSDETIVSVNSSGLVTALKAGGVTITASVDGGVSASAVVSAIAPKAAVASIALSAGTTQLKIGQLTQISAVVRDANGNILSSVPVTFSSTPSTVATVSGSGMTAGVSVGSATVYAKADTVVRSIGLTVLDTATSITPPPPPTTPAGIAILPGESIQAKVDANPAGTTFILKSGTHVRQNVVPKDGNVFRGEAGTVLDGQNATAFAFRGWNGSRWINSVTLRNFSITRYTPPAQNGAIWGGDDLANGTSGWTLDSMEVSYSSNLGVRIGNRMRVLRSNLHHNATINIGGVGRAVVVDGTSVTFGNPGCINQPGFESGGSKFVKTDSLIVRNSTFSDNCGVGLWLDILNVNYQLSNNTVARNVREGICIEVSYGGKIFNNIVTGNGWPTDPYRPNGWLWDAGIGIHASPDVEVYGNTLNENFQGIVILQQPRNTSTGDSYAPAGGFIAQNVYVHDNTIYQRTAGGPNGGDGSAASGAANDAGDLATFTSRNNRWVNNTYYLGTNPRPFAWMSGFRTAAEWRAYGQDVTGSFNP